MSLLARLNLTWQAVVALALILGFGAWLAYLHPALIPALVPMLAGGGLLAQAPPVVGPKADDKPADPPQ
jgi:hypothetical protein